MTHALVTFLGRTPKDAGGYKTTRYRFPDGSESEPTAFLGWTLAKKRRPRPDRLVVLGTQGSMWDFLGEQAGIAEGDESMGELWDSLERSVNAACVPEEDLKALAPLVSKHVGIDTCLRIIPNGVTQREQVEVLQAMADATEDCSEVTLDVSHGFRHLPMIAVVAAVYLRTVRDLKVREIWYGFRDPDTGIGTAHDLKGLLYLFDWVGALSQFEHSGDYGVFGRLLTREGRAELEAPMREAAFFERATREELANRKIMTVFRKLRQEPLVGIGKLFQSELEDRLSWALEDNPQRRQRALASRYLERRDYLRAAVYAFEAFITHLVCKDGGDHESHRDRDDAKKVYEDSPSFAYLDLRDLRNALVHVSRPHDREVRRATKEEKGVRRIISEFLDEFPDDRAEPATLIPTSEGHDAE